MLKPREALDPLCEELDSMAKAALIYRAAGYETQELTMSNTDRKCLLVAKSGRYHIVHVQTEVTESSIMAGKLRYWADEAKLLSLTAATELGRVLHTPEVFLISPCAAPSDVFIALATSSGSLVIQDVANHSTDPSWLSPEGYYSSWGLLKLWVGEFR